MEHWRSSQNLTNPLNGLNPPPPRVLAPSSGNAQTYALDHTDGIENQNPLTINGGVTAKIESPYPIPDIKLKSNDKYSENLLHLQVRRIQNREKYHQRPKFVSERPYLQHPKYIEYRTRPRRDTGKDGKPIWDDRIETAFQNALVHIEPMGKRKKSQKGRPHGRNELIRDWIFEETGEVRDRKQISSHIQVLNGVLRGIPEWDALTIPRVKSGSEPEPHQYYYDSIPQMVRSQRESATNGFPNYSGSDNQFIPQYLSATPAVHHERHSLARLSFEMWVSLPDRMDQALHNYTRLQTISSTVAPAPLEDIRNWRSLYPNLQLIFDSWSTTNECDVIMLDVSFQLLSDYPPKHSKLGISLELDFLDPKGIDSYLTTGLNDWRCTTHMHQHGRLVKETTHDSCHVIGVGKVKPFFESKWWALTFIQLTKKRKQAEDSGNDAVLEAANEACRNFFRGLTIMQEISAGSTSGAVIDGIYADNHGPQKRMAILLWRFSEAQSGFVGTTTWRKLIPPPARISTNSPPPPNSELALPPLVMDSMIDGANDSSFYDSSTDFLSQQSHQQYNGFSHEDEVHIDHQSSYGGFKHSGTTSLGHFEMSLGSTTVQDEFMPPDHYHHDHEFHLALRSRGPQNMRDRIGQIANDSNIGLHMEEEEKTGVHLSGLHSSFDVTDNNHHTRYEPLANFDTNTHRLLQAQLAIDESSSGRNRVDRTHSQPDFKDDDDDMGDDDEQVLREAMMATSTENELGRQSEYSDISQSFPAPVPIRPSLQSYHSFSGPTGIHHHQRSDSKEEFMNVIANLQAFNENDQVNPFPGENILTFGHRSETQFQQNISRPQSQPAIPTSNDNKFELLDNGFTEVKLEPATDL